MIYIPLTVFKEQNIDNFNIYLVRNKIEITSYNLYELFCLLIYFATNSYLQESNEYILHIIYKFIQSIREKRSLQFPCMTAIMTEKHFKGFIYYI